MSDEVFKAIGQIAIFLTALAGLISSLLNRKQAKENAAKLEAVHQDVNGKMEQLLKTHGAEQRAVGEITGREKAKAEVTDKLASIEKVVVDHDEWERGTKKPDN